MLTFENKVNELSDFSDTDSVSYKKKYLQQIVDHGKDYYNYAQWAYNTICKRLVKQLISPT